ncbi:MAG: enoyl-CoA hydratase/isomerase family protein, partial [Candidatus Rokuibacteriota bacterium]
HSEIPLLCDIVLAADTAQFQDSAHFPSDVVPGDGMHIVYPLLLGMNRGHYFLLTGHTRSARKALELGLVAEVLPPDQLLPRAWELAEDLARRPTLLLRYTRLLLTEALRRQMHDLLGYGLGIKLLALGEKAGRAGLDRLDRRLLQGPAVRPRHLTPGAAAGRPSGPARQPRGAGLSTTLCAACDGRPIHPGCRSCS